MAAIELAHKEPWRAIEIEQAGCSVEGCQGYTLLRMKLKASGEKNRHGCNRAGHMDDGAPFIDPRSYVGQSAIWKLCSKLPTVLPSMWSWWA